ncbi:MAG: TraB/GumN family protein [Flavobacteriales bacterium]|nr:TraB/GumN family protein [Flavobacteriales bacterium]
MKQTIIIIALCFACLPCFSQSSVWKVNGKGTTMYIGGTIHLLRAEDYPLPAEYDTAYAHSETLVFEVDMDKMSDPENSKKLLSKMMFTDEQTLSGTLKNKTYEKLKTACIKLNLPIEKMEQFKPAMVIMTIMMIKMNQLNISSDGVDKYYFNKSQNDEKEYLFLETLDEQTKVLSNMGSGNIDEFVLQSLKDYNTMEKYLLEMIATWRDGTAKIMLKQIEEMKSDYPATYKSILLDRNNAWMPKIEGFLDNERVEFILVGALHLHGEEGVLKQLEDKGYTIEQLKL